MIARFTLWDIGQWHRVAVQKTYTRKMLSCASGSSVNIAARNKAAWCLISRSEYKLGGEALIQFGEKECLTHQLSGEPKTRFVSTALVMMAIALMVLALMLLTPTGVQTR